jgi:hypothetical protein
MASARGESCMSFCSQFCGALMDEGQDDYTSTLLCPHCPGHRLRLRVLQQGEVDGKFICSVERKRAGRDDERNCRGEEEMRKGPGERARLSFHCKVMGNPLLASTGRSWMASAGGGSLIGRW